MTDSMDRIVLDLAEGCAEVMLEAHRSTPEGRCRCGEHWPCEHAQFALLTLSGRPRCRAAKAISAPYVAIVEFRCVLHTGHDGIPHAWQRVS